MDTEYRWLRLRQLSETLESYSNLRNALPPPNGWLRAVRQAIGRTTVQQAERASIAQSGLVRAEKAETTGAITLRQLRKLANALDCDLHYALIPRQPLQQVVEERAHAIARDRVQRAAHSMALENQESSKEFADKQVREVQRKLLAGTWSRLWQ